VLALASSLTRNPLFKICWPWRVGKPGNRLPPLHFLQAFLHLHFFAVKTPCVRLQAYFIFPQYFTSQKNPVLHSTFMNHLLLSQVTSEPGCVTKTSDDAYVTAHATIKLSDVSCSARQNCGEHEFRWDCICSMYTTDNWQTSKRPRLQDIWCENNVF